MGVLCRVVSGARENSPCWLELLLVREKIRPVCPKWPKCADFVRAGRVLYRLRGWVYGCAASSGVRCERKFALRVQNGQIVPILCVLGEFCTGGWPDGVMLGEFCTG